MLHNKSDTRQRQGTMDPTPFDVLMGRSKHCYHHVGNQVFRALIINHVNRYAEASSKREKMAIVTYLLDLIRDGGGRFLKEDQENRYYQVETRVAREKISHALRDQWHQRLNRPTTKTTEDMNTSFNDSGDTVMSDPFPFVDLGYSSPQNRDAIGRPPDHWRFMVLESLQKSTQEAGSSKPAAKPDNASSRQDTGLGMSHASSALGSAGAGLKPSPGASRLVASRHESWNAAAAARSLGSTSSLFSTGTSFNDWDPRIALNPRPLPTTEWSPHSSRPNEYLPRRPFEQDKLLSLDYRPRVQSFSDAKGPYRSMMGHSWIGKDSSVLPRHPLEPDKPPVDSMHRSHSFSASMSSYGDMGQSLSGNTPAFASASNHVSDDIGHPLPVTTNVTMSDELAETLRKSSFVQALDVPDHGVGVSMDSGIHVEDHMSNQAEVASNDAVGANLGDPEAYTDKQLDAMLLELFQK